MIKKGVTISKLTPQAVLAFVIVQPIFHRRDRVCIMTSGDDSTHKPTSKHYTGDAFDLRSKHLRLAEKGEVLVEMKEALGENYDVIIELVGEPLEHYHIEYDPKPKPQPQVVA